MIVKSKIIWPTDEDDGPPNDSPWWLLSMTILATLTLVVPELDPGPVNKFRESFCPTADL